MAGPGADSESSRASKVPGVTAGLNAETGVWLASAVGKPPRAPVLIAGSCSPCAPCIASGMALPPPGATADPPQIGSCVSEDGAGSERGRLLSTEHRGSSISVPAPFQDWKCWARPTHARMHMDCTQVVSNPHESCTNLQSRCASGCFLHVHSGLLPPHLKQWIYCMPAGPAAAVDYHLAPARLPDWRAAASATSTIAAAAGRAGPAAPAQNESRRGAAAACGAVQGQGWGSGTPPAARSLGAVCMKGFQGCEWRSP
jgi:hypothetical protein